MSHFTDVQVGQAAPDFTLQDENENDVTLSALRGRPVVLIFYPFDWSGLCTTEMCDMRDGWDQWKDSPAHVYGISRDSVYSHKAWREHLGLGFSLLADLTGEVARLYGAWNDEFHRADRMTVIIDAEGKVSYVVHNHAGKVRDPREALDAVLRLQGAEV
jgi:peroxiredoxin